MTVLRFLLTGGLKYNPVLRVEQQISSIQNMSYSIRLVSSFKVNQVSKVPKHMQTLNKENGEKNPMSM